LIASDTEQRDQRAYLLVKGIEKPIQNFVTGGDAHVFATFENIGKTPVYEARWVSRIDVLSYPSKPPNMSDCDAIMKLPDATRAFFGKEQSFDKERKLPFTQAEIDAVNSGRFAIYFFGRVCYSDTFKYSHYTDFCLSWRAINSELVASSAQPATKVIETAFGFLGLLFGIDVWAVVESGPPRRRHASGRWSSRQRSAGATHCREPRANPPRGRTGPFE
jgi:hypothetical protein